MQVNLDKITKNGKALFLAYDQGLEHGPTDFNEESVNPLKVLEIADSGFFTGLILQKGIAEKYFFNKNYQVPLIVKLNGKTNLIKDEDPYSPQICSVAEALSYGAAAVGYTIYIGSEHEPKMTAEFGKIEQEAEEAGIPVIAWMYPRGRNIPDEKDPKIIAYAARVGLELGADIIKIRYTGDPVSFNWVIRNAGEAKVVVMGGSKEDEKTFLERTSIVMDQGAIGLAVGRNIWQNPQPLKIAKKIAEIIWN
ncbi:fructose-bisphosphate aldolase [Candidatus Shapirobacteria bacterium CG03_land_8_20_14_0_80_40_19]|uniref:Fructose-bisphosphate aldolase n=2 Tax=Candidatus Shapironibacteriota TaxID=1752721 RepID=A0A2M7BCL4_9BACT|nr:MAG: fructose-bisphosphate aldolase [Candidatus Shapirobacteria bacterium CG11_big_fil_rev_8_21_14_0_20_40_12]PIV00854.1 MAG: fructose-bisphosphate aldolase [Candidatus Shapirobacteria bacterium CG03_land_8_20_14_0_80_40_19]